MQARESVARNRARVMQAREAVARNRAQDICFRRSHALDLHKPQHCSSSTHSSADLWPLPSSGATLTRQAAAGHDHGACRVHLIQAWSHHIIMQSGKCDAITFQNGLKGGGGMSTTTRLDMMPHAITKRADVCVQDVGPASSGQQRVRPQAG